MPSKLDKLRRLSWHELRTRSAQTLTKLSERYLGRGAHELNEAELLREWQTGARTANEAAAKLLERLRQAPLLFPALSQRAALVEVMQTRFATERAALLARADRVLAGRFDIFEHEGLSYGEPPSGKVDWHFEPSSGKRTPLAHWSAIDFLNPAVAGDKKFTWELNRCQFFVTLGQAYWLTGEEKYAAKFVELASSWLDANPPKRGINWASSLEVAFRVIAWLWALHLFADAQAVTPEFTARLLKSLIAQGRHIETYLSHYFSPNTHLTGEALGLFYLGTALPELRRAEHWRRLGLQILLEQLPVQVRRDGVYFEQASYYHRYTADFYTHLWLLCQANGIELPPLVEEKLVGLHEHLLWITRPDGTSPFYGDDDGGRLVMLGTRHADDFRDTLATGAALFQRGDWKFVAGAAAVETLWLLGTEGLRAFDELKAHAPDAQQKAFGASGVYVLRDGWTPGASYLLIDCGPFGVYSNGHSHSDALSFEYAAGGATWLVDPGTITYTGDLRLRNEIRCSQNHTTVSVDGLSQAVPHTAFTWAHTANCLAREFRETSEGGFFCGQQDGYARLADPVRQQRSFWLNRVGVRHLQVTDRLEAKDAHRYQWHFHFAAGCRAALDGQSVRVTAPTGQELMLTARADGAHIFEFAVTDGWVSRGYGQREAAPVITITTQARGLVTVETLFVPLPDARAEAFVRQWQQHVSPTNVFGG